MTARVEAPDGGWGWAVVSGTALINVFNQSLLSLFGLIFGPTLQSIAGSTGVTTVMSINCTISNFSGLLISPLSKYFTTKQITQIGVLLVSAGLVFSTYAHSYARIIIGYGLLTGLGFGLIASSTFLIINSYFSRKKSQAVGLSMAGTSIGQMIMPLAVALLIDHYSYDGTVMILSALSLHGLIGSMFFDPVSEHVKTRYETQTTGVLSQLQPLKTADAKDNFVNEKPNECSNNTDNLIMTEIENNQSVISKLNSREEKKSVIKPKNDDTSYDVEGNEFVEEANMLPSQLDISNEKRTNFCEKLVALFDFHILLDPIFVHIMIGLSMAYTTSISFSTFFPLFLTIDLDMTIIDASTCMSVLSFMDFLGRIVVPLATDHMNITHRTTFIFGSFLLAGCRAVLVMQTSYTMIIVLSGICGIARAITVINQNLVIAEYSKEYVSSAVGLNMVSKGIFVLTIGRMLGRYKDSAHNYSGCIQILNVISSTVAVSWTLEVFYRKMFKKS